MQVCFGGVEGTDIIAAPEFEGLCGRQRPGSDDSLLGIGFVDGKVHSAEDVFGCLHGPGFVYIRQTNLLDDFPVLRPGTSRKYKCTSNKCISHKRPCTLILVYFFGLLHFKSVHFGKWLNSGDDYIGSVLLAQEGIVFFEMKADFL